MILPILAETARLDLTEAGYAGLVAVYRPMDTWDKGTWFDEVKYDVKTTEAASKAVRQQLIAVEGITVGDDATPFDPKNPAHFRALPIGIVLAVYSDMMQRSSLTETQRKN